MISRTKDIEAPKRKPLAKIDKAHIDRILGWVHIATSNRGAIRAVFDRLDKHRFWNLHKETRKEFYRYVLKVHKDNRDLYYFVMRGI